MKYVSVFDLYTILSESLMVQRVAEIIGEWNINRVKIPPSIHEAILKDRGMMHQIASVSILKAINHEMDVYTLSENIVKKYNGDAALVKVKVDDVEKWLNKRYSLGVRKYVLGCIDENMDKQ